MKKIVKNKKYYFVQGIDVSTKHVLILSKDRGEVYWSSYLDNDTIIFSTKSCAMKEIRKEIKIDKLLIESEQEREKFIYQLITLSVDEVEDVK